MLTSEDVKFRLKVLIILASIAILLLIGGAVVMFISSYYGFTASSPIKCTTGTYVLNKYMASNCYLSSSFAGMILACVWMIFALILGIYYLFSLNEMKNSEEEKQFCAITQEIVKSMYIVTALGMLGACIPLGYFLSFMLEATSQCSMSMDLYWLIIAGAAGLAEALMIACLIILMRMQAQMEDEMVEGAKKEEKDAAEKKIAQVQSEILNRDKDQKAPLLQKQIIEEGKPEPVQHNQKDLPMRNQQNIPAYQQNPLQDQPQQIQLSRFVTQNVKAEPIQATYQHTIPQQRQIKNQRHMPEQVQTEPLRDFSGNSSNQVNKESKIEVKPQAGQTVTHITVNFPNSYSSQPQLQPSIQTSSRKEIKERRQVIKQSMEEQLSSDSDDHYYKRARKNKKRKFLDDEKDKLASKKRRKDDVDVDYQREFDRIPSRFKVTPSQPKYVVLSPQSMRTFYDFVKNQHENDQKKSRNFVMPQKHHAPPSPTYKKNPPKERKYHSPQNREQSNLLKPDRHEISQVKEYNQTAPRNIEAIIKQQQKQQVKERSIYQKLDFGQESDNSMKKYEHFFRSSRHLLKRQDTDHDKKSQYDEYFNLLNGSHAGKKDSPNAQQNYKSISNYSSVLNEQGSGKMPMQREHHGRINVDQNKIHSKKGKAQRQSSHLIDQIRSKYS